MIFYEPNFHDLDAIIVRFGHLSESSNQGQKEFNRGVTVFLRIKISREWNYYLINYIGYLIKNINAI